MLVIDGRDPVRQGGQVKRGNRRQHNLAMRRRVRQRPDVHVPTAVVVLDRTQTRARVRIPEPEGSVARDGDDVFVRNGDGVHRGAMRAQDVLAS